MAVDMFLKLEGVEGESTDETHKGEIELLSVSLGASNAVDISSATGGAGVGKVNFQDISCVSQMGKHSTTLFQKCCSGQHFPTAKITCRKAGDNQEDFMVVDLKEVFVSQYSLGTGGGDVPTESFSLSFAEIGYDYKAQDEKGGTKSVGKKTWNLRTNKAS